MVAKSVPVGPPLLHLAAAAAADQLDLQDVVVAPQVRPVVTPRHLSPVLDEGQVRRGVQLNRGAARPRWLLGVSDQGEPQLGCVVHQVFAFGRIILVAPGLMRGIEVSRHHQCLFLDLVARRSDQGLLLLAVVFRVTVYVHQEHSALAAFTWSDLGTHLLAFGE